MSIGAYDGWTLVVVVASIWVCWGLYPRIPSWRSKGFIMTIWRCWVRTQCRGPRLSLCNPKWKCPLMLLRKWRPFLVLWLSIETFTSTLTMTTWIIASTAVGGFTHHKCCCHFDDEKNCQQNYHLEMRETQNCSWLLFPFSPFLFPPKWLLSGLCRKMEVYLYVEFMIRQWHKHQSIQKWIGVPILFDTSAPMKYARQRFSYMVSESFGF